MSRLLKNLFLLSLPLLLNACGGGGGGGGAAGGGSSYTVPNCTDSGNSTIRDDEYYGMSKCIKIKFYCISNYWFSTSN